METARCGQREVKKLTYYRKKQYQPTVRFSTQIVNKSSEDSFAFAFNRFNQLIQIELTTAVVASNSQPIRAQGPVQCHVT